MKTLFKIIFAILGLLGLSGKASAKKKAKVNFKVLGPKQGKKCTHGLLDGAELRLSSLPLRGCSSQTTCRAPG